MVQFSSTRLLHYSKWHLLKHKGFKLDPGFKLKCGLEIHTQLKTKYKLFSLSSTSFNSKPNSKVSYFDCGLPGTFPQLNPEAVFLALRTAVALNCEVQRESSFDRKHYFYPDQPLGYQITQYFHPIATNGFLELSGELDEIDSNRKIIGIERIQIEQDTGKTKYNKHDKTSEIDLNRSDIPLIEMVTKPDFGNLVEIRAFLKKYQRLMEYMEVCVGDLETGAMRADVNVSVNDGPRVEIKNLGSSGEIVDALKYEYKRQAHLLKQSGSVEHETRSWTGKETVRSRGKEGSIDYRYLPDPELPRVLLDANIANDIRDGLPEFPESILKRLIGNPFCLELKHAKFFVSRRDILAYYFKLFDIVVEKEIVEAKHLNNWLIHEFIGTFGKLKLPLDLNIIQPLKFAEIIQKVENDELTLASAKTLLMKLLKTPQDSNIAIDEIIQKYDLGNISGVPADELSDAIKEVCFEIVQDNPEVVANIRKGDYKKINYLIGLSMKQTKGKLNSKIIEKTLKDTIGIQ